MKVHPDNRTFEETVADERKLLREGKESEEMLSEEQMNEIVDSWFAEHKAEWPESKIPDLPAENGLSGIEFERAFEEQLKQKTMLLWLSCVVVI